jgi:exoribonuclease-2
LSTDLTSLNENQDRVALVMDLVFGADAELLRSSVYRAVVRNHAQLTYGSVAAWLNGTQPPAPAIVRTPGLEANLRLQDSLAGRLAERRHRTGALSLETLEARATFSGDSLSRLDIDPKDRAKQLIEEFMVAANGVSAEFLAQKHSSSLRRVLRSPERWSRIVELARSRGEELPAKPDGPALERFLTRQRTASPTAFPDLSLSVVKLLGRGEYTFEPPGFQVRVTLDWQSGIIHNRRLQIAAFPT